MLLAPLEEMEKNITGFYQALEKASRITSAREPEAAGDFKQKCQVTEQGYSSWRLKGRSPGLMLCSCGCIAAKLK